MPAPNRVTPLGEIVAIEQRGTFMGNRGCIHRAPGEIARRWQVRRWITCVLEYKGWVAPKWQPGRWTPLFFWDEAVALAAGHRPCALCRRAAYDAWLDAWEAAFGDRPRADPMDVRLHADRVDPTGGRAAGSGTGRADGSGGRGRRWGQRRHSRSWSGLPVGAFVLVDEVVPALVLADRLLPWSSAGYGAPLDRPTRGTATVLTPSATVEVLGHGYQPVIHPSAAEPAQRAGPRTRN